MNLNYDATVSYVLRRLKIPNSEIFSIFINSRLVTKKDVLLNEGDKIVFLPLVGGG
jgi:molybdopterin converting factor small subunit